MLSSRENLTALMDLSGVWIDSVQECAPLDRLILDLDSSQSETYGNQEGPAYNGHFDCTGYRPLFLFNQLGDLERVMLRRGNHASAKFRRRVLLPVIERYRDRDIPKYFRGDAATEREIGDSLGRRLTLRRDPPKPRFRRREWPDRHLRVPGGRSLGRSTGRTSGVRLDQVARLGRMAA
jgi:hypothetical protein